MQRLILPVDQTWNTSGIAPSIADWETRTGLQLPDDYRDFMVRYNGGRPFPMTFRHCWPEDSGEIACDETYLEPLHDWHHLVAWTSELGERLPPRTLAIGANPGLIEILLSLRPDDHGAVYSWVRNWDNFGPGNDYLFRQASSFREFVDSLYDDGDNLDHWRRPGTVQLERPFQF